MKNVEGHVILNQCTPELNVPHFEVALLPAVIRSSREKVGVEGWRARPFLQFVCLARNRRLRSLGPSSVAAAHNSAGKKMPIVRFPVSRSSSRTNNSCLPYIRFTVVFLDQICLCTPSVPKIAEALCYLHLHKPITKVLRKIGENNIVFDKDQASSMQYDVKLSYTNA